MLTIAEATELDNGPRAHKPGTERLCALTRTVRPIDEMIRFVAGPDGQVLPDLKRKLPGRGLWLSNSRQAVIEAATRGLFAKGFKRQVIVSPALADDTDALLVSSLSDGLAMAAKAGQVLSGFTKVERALTGAEVVALIHAADGAADGIRKLNAIAGQSVKSGESNRLTVRLPVIDALASAQLDLALGRSNVIHAALLAGAAAKTVLSRSDALARFRNDGDTVGRG